MNRNLKVAYLTEKDISSFTNLWNRNPDLLTSSSFIMTNNKALQGFKKKMFDYFGLYENDKLIGFVLYQHKDDEIWLKHMLIDKNHRKQKLGTTLLKQSLATYKNRKIKTEVLFENTNAMNFFIKNGFKTLSKDEAND